MLALKHGSLLELLHALNGVNLQYLLDVSKDASITHMCYSTRSVKLSVQTTEELLERDCLFERSALLILNMM